MTFTESIKTVLISKYATFSGRATRSEYWWFTLFSFVVQIGLMIVSGILNSSFLLIAYLVIFLATIIPATAVTVRRLHDTDRSGWWILLSLVPLGFIVLIVWFASRGTQGTNRFGPELSSTGVAMKDPASTLNPAD